MIRASSVPESTGHYSPWQAQADRWKFCLQRRSSRTRGKSCANLENEFAREITSNLQTGNSPVHSGRFAKTGCACSKLNLRKTSRSFLTDTAGYHCHLILIG